jgi:hypothetical protein
MNAHLTIPNPSLDAHIRATYCGMAHWAGTGPQGETCRTCAHWTGCGKADGQNGAIGAAVPHDALACRHFVAAVKPPSISGK